MSTVYVIKDVRDGSYLEPGAWDRISFSTDIDEAIAFKTLKQANERLTWISRVCAAKFVIETYNRTPA